MGDRQHQEVGGGARGFAAVMGLTCIAIGIYGIWRTVDGDAWYIAALGAAAVIYGSLWANVALTGRHSRIPLWL